VARVFFFLLPRNGRSRAGGHATRHKEEPCGPTLFSNSAGPGSTPHVGVSCSSGLAVCDCHLGCAAAGKPTRPVTVAPSYTRIDGDVCLGSYLGTGLYMNPRHGRIRSSRAVPLCITCGCILQITSLPKQSYQLLYILSRAEPLKTLYMIVHTLKRAVHFAPRAGLTARMATMAGMNMAQSEAKGKREGDISDSFASLSGQEERPLPDRFRQLKLSLIAGHEDQVRDGWKRLLLELKHENDIVATKGPGVIPEVEFANLDADLSRLSVELKQRGAAVIRGVVPENEARAYKAEIEEYVQKNPGTRGTFQHFTYLFRFCTIFSCSTQDSPRITRKFSNYTGRRRS